MAKDKGEDLRLEENKDDRFAPVGFKSLLLRYEDSRDFPEHLTTYNVKIAFEEELGENTTKPGIASSSFYIIVYVPKGTTNHQAMNCLANVRALTPN